MRRSAIILTGLLLLSPLRGQLQVPGTPLRDPGPHNAADLIYLLPPIHPLEEEAFLRDAEEQFARSKVGKFAVERFVDLDPESSGVWVQQDGYRVWRVHLISPGALSMGLIFHPFRLEEGVKLLVYDPDMKQVKGAYTEINNKASGLFPVGHIAGEELLVELQVPAAMDSYGELGLRSLSHALLPVALKEQKSGSYGDSGDCEIDVACSEGAHWQSEKRSVVRIYTSTQYCTGVVINNTTMDGDPLLLTAKHCIDREYYASSSVFDFNYESPSCFGGDGSLDMSISGAELLAVGDSIDFSLVRISLPPPDSFKVSYAGWDLGEEVADYTTVIHHPEGDVKKISFDYDAPTATSDPDDIPSYFWEFLPHSFWWVKQWDVGSTEPGSSGSPLFNSEHRVIGLLSFGSAACGDSIGYNYETGRVIYSKVDNVNDYFSRLGVAWDHDPDPGGSLRTWLDPSSTGQTSLDTYDPLSAEPPETEPDQLLRLWPNPAGDRVYLEAFVSLPGLSEIRIWDVRGTELMSMEADLQAPFLLELCDLPPGFYVLKVLNGSFREARRLIISK